MHMRRHWTLRALAGLMSLSNEGMLHRDVSAGTVFLVDNLDKKVHGYIVDVDYAKVSFSFSVKTMSNSRSPSRIVLPMSMHTEGVLG